MFIRDMSTFSKIEAILLDLSIIYMPNLSLNEIAFNQVSMDANTLAVKIAYSIPSLEVSDLLHFTI